MFLSHFFSVILKPGRQYFKSSEEGIRNSDLGGVTKLDEALKI